VGYSSEQMRAELGPAITILAFWAVPDAIGQNRFQPVKFGPLDVGVPIDHDSGQLLTAAGMALPVNWRASLTFRLPLLSGLP
jgi:hypothetical protein